MKASKGVVEKALFKMIAIAGLVALSACAEPRRETTTTNLPPVTQPPTIPTVTPPLTTTSPVTPSPVGTTANRNLAQLAESAASQGQFKTLTRAVQAAGLNNQLTTPGPYTVFAPTDAAFAALPKSTLDNLLKPENKQKLVRLLAYHVIPGQVTSSQLTSGQVKTIEGTPVTVKVDSTGKTITVNGAKVTQADIPASNGIVHIVDKVILPPNFSGGSAKTTSTPSPTSTPPQ
ncbi:fasciclin domain-containing protein [Nostoc sp. CENA67]|uniref:Fasciclin domain-containing protein n=1 Tax=Amazonocrinis nigriterrae CENA67 TaxID=2794033 RepID=A0A8J7HS01_9NOST|nr:fasciclin domain-containing protein [Amazonocrinis nigriterrae]MBH8564397.1 fasciclin domain-containing protein [Amazonocrinis nigriterrae CENA67]